MTFKKGFLGNLLTYISVSIILVKDYVHYTHNPLTLSNLEDQDYRYSSGDRGSLSMKTYTCGLLL